MKKLYRKLFALLISAAAVTAVLTANISYARFSEGEKCKEAKIYIQGSITNFSGDTFVLFGETMIPVTEFLSKIGIQSTWDSYTDQLIVYDNNIYIKLLQNKFLAFVNGLQTKIQLPAVLYKGELYAPASFLLNALEIDHSQSGEILDVNHFESKGDTLQESYTTYKRYALFDEGINLFVPIEYSYNDGEFRSEIDDSVVKAVKKSEYNFSGEPTETKINGFLKFTATDAGGNAFSYYSSDDSDYALAFIGVNPVYEEKIMESVDIDSKLPNTKLEHYYEFAAFHSFEIALKSPIYSNMLVDGFTDFSGTANRDGKIKLRVYTATGKHEYLIDITGGVFTGRLYLPLGAGKHNVVISIIDTEGVQHEAMWFSAINISDKIILDLVPTSYMDFGSDSVRAALAKIGSYGINQKSTAEKIYKWITENYELDSDAAAVKKMSEIIESGSKISPQEACVLYAGLLRATEIPAKIASKRGAKHYWVEAYLNGAWKSMGIVSDLKNKTFFYFYKALSDPDPEYLSY